MSGANKLKNALFMISKYSPQALEEQLVKLNLHKQLNYKILNSNDPASHSLQHFQTPVDILGLFWAQGDQVENVLRRNPSINWVHSFTIGVDWFIKNDYMRNHPAPLTNAKGAYSDSLGEWVALGMLWHTKHCLKWWKLKNEANWNPGSIKMVSEQTLGIFGYGDIGTHAAKIVKNGFGSRIIGMKNNPKNSTPEQRKYVDEIVGQDQLDYMLSESDYVCNLTPLTDQTRNFWNMEKFKKMKKGAVFISIGRGPTVIEEDLITCLKDGTLSGAVMDVFKTEPLPKDSELWKLENVYITPHCCDVTEDYHERSVINFSANLERYLKGEKLQGMIDKQKNY